METIHSPEGVSLLMENIWLRHKAGIGQRKNNVFMVELPPLTPEEKAEIRRKDEEAKGIVEDSQEELFGGWI